MVASGAMAFTRPWTGTGNAGAAPGATLGIATSSPSGKDQAVGLHFENKSANTISISFDGGKTYSFDIPTGLFKDFTGLMGDEVFVKAAVASAYQWVAHGGSP